MDLRTLAVVARPTEGMESLISSRSGDSAKPEKPEPVHEAPIEERSPRFTVTFLYGDAIQETSF